MFAINRVITTLPVSDMDRAVAWYAEKLGLKAATVIEGEGTFYETAAGTFALYPSAHAGHNPGTAAAFAVDDFDTAVRQLRNAGITFEEFDPGDATMVDGVLTTPSGVKAVWFKDSEDNILALSNRQI